MQHTNAIRRKQMASQSPTEENEGSSMDARVKEHWRETGKYTRNRIGVTDKNKRTEGRRHLGEDNY